MVPDRSGPHLNFALIAERVLTERDGVLTPVRIVDRMTFAILPDAEGPAPANLTLLVGLKSGGARGSYTMEIKLEQPSGEQTTFAPPANVFLEGEERGVSLLIPFQFAPEHQGLYWFDVYFEDERITRVPLRAIYQRVQALPPKDSP